MKVIISVFALCFLLSGPSYGQNDCGCGDYVKIAIGTTWYKSSTSEQRDYLHLLDVSKPVMMLLAKPCQVPEQVEVTRQSLMVVYQ